MFRVFFQLPPLPKYQHAKRRAGWSGSPNKDGDIMPHEYLKRESAQTRVDIALNNFPDCIYLVVDMDEVAQELS